MISASQNTCITCPWFAAVAQECRESGPRAFPIPDRTGNIGVMGAWPATRESNWCAKHPLNQMSALRVVQ
jgi:hypothetical protein